MKMKKGTIIAIVAVGAAFLGGLVAFALYLRAKARDLSEKLDFDGDLYDEDDSLFDTPVEECCHEGCCCHEEEDDDIDSLPIADEASEDDEQKD